MSHDGSTMPGRVNHARTGQPCQDGYNQALILQAMILQALVHYLAMILQALVHYLAMIHQAMLHQAMLHRAMLHHPGHATPPRPCYTTPVTPPGYTTPGTPSCTARQHGMAQGTPWSPYTAVPIAECRTDVTGFPFTIYR